MKKTWITIIVIVIIVLIGIWIWSANKGPGSAPSYTAPVTDQSSAPMMPATSTPISTPVVTTGSNAKLGSYLVATNGMTLYTYKPDKTNMSVCSGTCAAAWPPYTSTSTLIGGTDATGTLATYVRSDGSTQVTYNGRPVYFYSKDKNPGDTNGQGIGGVWYVVNP